MTHDPGRPSATACNETFGILPPDALDAMEREAAGHVEALFRTLGVDAPNCHNTRGTALRHARMLVRETLAGRYEAPPRLTDFDNPCRFSDLVVVGPIDVRSTCAHHLMPIYGDAYVGLLPSPDGRILGLSKFDRVVHHFAARLQIQEEMTAQVADFLMAGSAASGVAVRVSAVHMCRTHRGVRAPRHGRMVTTVARGSLVAGEARREFLAECALREAGSP